MEKIQVRVSQVAQVDKNPACSYARIMLGLKGKAGIAALMGTARHNLRYWYNSKSAKLSYALRDKLTITEIYDLLKELYSEGVVWSVEETRKKALRSDNYEITEKELIFIEKELTSDALSEAITLSVNIKNYRSFWLGYENPHQLHMEEELITKDYELDGVFFTITSHPDVYMWVPQGDTFMVIDYKTGRPATINDWIATEHYNQLCGYAFQIRQETGQPCKLGKVIYTQDVGVWGHRMCLINEDFFLDCLRTIASWIHGNIPEKYQCPYRGKYCPQESKEKCMRFFGW